MICLFLQESLLRHPFSKAMEAAETTPGVSGEPSCLTLPSRRHTFTYPIICIPNAFLNKGKSINYSRRGVEESLERIPPALVLVLIGQLKHIQNLF